VETDDLMEFEIESRKRERSFSRSLIAQLAPLRIAISRYNLVARFSWANGVFFCSLFVWKLEENDEHRLMMLRKLRASNRLLTFAFPQRFIVKSSKHSTLPTDGKVRAWFIAIWCLRMRNRVVYWDGDYGASISLIISRLLLFAIRYRIGRLFWRSPIQTIEKSCFFVSGHVNHLAWISYKFLSRVVKRAAKHLANRTNLKVTIKSQF